MRIGTLPDGTRGFDANTRLTGAQARAFHAHGYRFVIRYVRRTTRHEYDVNAGELAMLLTAGLSVMLVQHVAPPGWMPTGAMGTEYGTTAAAESRLAGLPRGVTLWCDLEGVSREARAEDVIAFCNAWYDAAIRAGYVPGLYVGDSCGLTPTQLYQRLRFSRYWGAYNLNRDEEPAVRGLQMKQLPYPPAERRVPGISFEYDEDVIHVDAKGGTPVLLIP